VVMWVTLQEFGALVANIREWNARNRLLDLQVS